MPAIAADRALADMHLSATAVVEMDAIARSRLGNRPADIQTESATVSFFPIPGPIVAVYPLTHIFLRLCAAYNIYKTMLNVKILNPFPP